jgi:hypothetical protein
MPPKEPLFPIQGDRNRSAGHVPWSVATAAYATYSRLYGTGQSLERLAERGGFSWSELVWLLQGGVGKCETLPVAKPKEPDHR